MIIPEKIICDECKRQLSHKEIFFYHTDFPYYTIKRDDSVPYPGINIVRSKIHICQNCWEKLIKNTKGLSKNG